MINLVNNILRALLLVAVALLYTSCFTGVENTKKITDKDVERAVQQMESGRKVSSLDVFVDSLLTWREGKGFWCVDNQARLIFNPSLDYDIDTINLQGEMLTYAGYGSHRQLDNTEVVDIYLNCATHRLVYNTGKPLQEVNRSSFSIPFLIDGDLVNGLSEQLVGKTVYVKTPNWFSLETGIAVKGRHFIPVEILSVKPGDKVHPLKVEFREASSGDVAFVWMKIPGTNGAGRDFDALFSMTDVRAQYSSIAPAIWDNIVNGKVVEGMTKEECRLAMGNPVNVHQLPDQSGLREYWYYDGGRFLFFVDGVLREFR